MDLAGTSARTGRVARALLVEIDRLEAEVAELVGQRDLARALHEVMDGVFPPVCRTCRDADENPTAWPCSTADRLGAHAATPYVSPWGVTS